MKHRPEMTQEELMQKLRKHGISITQQRLVVLRCLMEAEGHPDAEEIYAAVGKQDQVISMATVYNTLNLFAAKGMLSTLEIDGHTLRFDKETAPHGHFQCAACGAIFNFPVEMEALGEALPGFLVTKQDVYLKGICPACREAGGREDDTDRQTDRPNKNKEETQ
jgi:Fe2+ or Zn2+ uptake regulation protein